MINFKNITQAIEEILIENLNNEYEIKRREQAPEDFPNWSNKKGWIGIYRSSRNYETLTTGSQPWLYLAHPFVSIHCYSLDSAEDCEDKLLDAEKKVLDALNANKKLNGTVDMTNGYDIEDDIDIYANDVWHQSLNIIINVEART